LFYLVERSYWCPKIRFFHWFVTMHIFYWSTNEITIYWKRNLYIIIATKLVAFDWLISRKNGSYLVAKNQQKQIVNSIQKALFFSLKIWLTWYWKPMIRPLPPPGPKKTNQLIHNYKTCIWDRYQRLLLTFFKGHSLLIELSSKNH